MFHPVLTKILITQLKTKIINHLYINWNSVKHLELSASTLGGIIGPAILNLIKSGNAIFHVPYSKLSK